MRNNMSKTPLDAKYTSGGVFYAAHFCSYYYFNNSQTALCHAFCDCYTVLN